MNDPVHVNIDLDQVSAIARVGVERAALFLGLGLNAMRRADFRDYQLNKLVVQSGQTSMPVDFFPSDLPNDTVDGFKKEFSLWVTGCGLREMLEHYALFLDHLHKYGLLVQQAKGLLGERDPEKEQRAFNRNGNMGEKLRLLKERFQVAPSEPETITQLYLARNCLTHDLGIVRAKHCDDQGIFRISWTTFDWIARGEETGSEQPLSSLIGCRANESISIDIRSVQRARSFNLGNKMEFSQQDLWELCLNFHQIGIPTIVTSFISFLKAHNLP
jgi:hypothetical protein